MNSKFKYLFKNTGLLFISNFSSKILVFLLVPFYTAVLSTEEYGSYDLLYTTVQMLAPILSANIIDAVMRFSIGTEELEQRRTFAIGLKYTSISVVVMALATWALAQIPSMELIREYQIPFILLFVTYSFNGFISQFARGIEDISGVAISGVLSTVSLIGFNLYFLLYLRLGLWGYFYANILAFTIPTVFLIFRDRLYRYVSFSGKREERKAFEKRMLLYCLPLIFTTLSWYINNVSDRYVVTWFCGKSVNGIYSVAYKIPAILNAMQVVFIQAWQLSAIREYNTKDRDAFYTKTYQGCHTIMVMLCSSLICGTRVLAKILFAKDFYAAWVFVPTLLIYIVFNTLSGTIGGVFTAVKDSGSITKAAVVGSLVNIFLNFILVYFMGAEGAAIATVISSIVIWVMRMRDSGKYVHLMVNQKRYVLEYGILGLQAAAMTLMESPTAYIVQIVLWGALLASNINTIRRSRK